MLRLLGFFVGVLVLLRVLQAVPVVGRLFHGFFGFWLGAIVLAALVGAALEWALRRRRLGHATRVLGHVETPHNQGKLGSLLASHARHARAVPCLERACAGEPQVAEWHYRLGVSLLALGRPQEALAALERTAALDAEHAYGGVQLALADAHARAGAPLRALAALEAFAHNHGPSPESAYRRALVLRRLGRKAEAAASLREVGALASQAARYQRRGHRGWVLRAWLARVV